VQRRRAILLAIPAAALVAGVTIGVVGQGSGGTDSVRLRTPGIAAEPSGAIPTAPKLTGRRLPAGSFAVLTGGSAAFASLAGRPAVINVWAESCVPCKAEMPAFEAVHRAFGDQVSFVGLNDGSDADETALTFAAKAGVTYPLWRDHDGFFTSTLSIAILPTTLIVGADGVIVQQHNGALGADQLTTMLRQVLATAGPTNPTSSTAGPTGPTSSGTATQP
jgi:thiol-disulfide isomerase/thioredoxin